MQNQSTNLNRRGSRSWLSGKLAAIESVGGIEARQLAADKWANLVWKTPIEAAFSGASAIENIHQITTSLGKIKDFAAANKIKQILNSGSDEKIAKISALLQKENIKNAIQFQSMNEDSIRHMSASFCTSENPKADLKIRRKWRKKIKQGTAELNMTLGLIGKNQNKHCTNFEISLRNQQKAKWRKFGSETLLTNQDKEIELLEVMKNSSKNRMAEILALTSGLEKFAEKKGMNWVFLTLTCPPEMHPNPSHGQNKWNGTLPDAAHQWIKEKYKKVDARLRKKGIHMSGLRVVEPHADGCPHWHLLIFAMPKNIAIIENEFRHSKNKEWQSEAGCKFVVGNGKAKASSYIFKYVLKTLSSVEKLEGELASVDSWRSTWAIRSFQFFGMPPIGLWRKLRMVKVRPMDENLAAIWDAAVGGDGEKFIELSGGLAVKSSTRPVHSTTENNTDSLVKIVTFFDKNTGAISDFVIEKWKFEKKTEPTGKNKKVDVIHSLPSQQASPKMDATLGSLLAGKPNQPQQRPPLGCQNPDPHHGKRTNGERQIQNHSNFEIVLAGDIFFRSSGVDFGVAFNEPEAIASNGLRSKV